MEDKINKLFDAIKPTNNYFSELVITRLIDDIIGDNTKDFHLLMPDINIRLGEFICTELNSITIKEGPRIRRYWDNIKDVCFLRFSLEMSGYNYNFFDNIWTGNWIPYIDINRGLLPTLEPFSSDEWALYMYITQGKGYIPFEIPEYYFQWRWEAFRRISPVFEKLDTYNKLKDELRLHGPHEVCPKLYGNDSMHGYEIMSGHIWKRMNEIKAFESKKIQTSTYSNLYQYINVTHKGRFLKRLHDLIDNRNGRPAVVPIKVAIDLKLMEKPSYKDYIREFGVKLAESGYSRAFSARYSENDIKNMETEFVSFAN